jgi:hypothetical protein
MAVSAQCQEYPDNARAVKDFLTALKSVLARGQKPL